MTRYFAYGANLDSAHFTRHCPGALRIGGAVLPDHEFLIAAKGYGRAAPAPGKDLPGVLWDLPPEDEVALDRFEGVPEGMYRKDFVTVRATDGSPHRAMLYLPTDPSPGLPVPGYLERIIVAAEALGFPAAYVASLRGQVRRDGPFPGP